MSESGKQLGDILGKTAEGSDASSSASALPDLDDLVTASAQYAGVDPAALRSELMGSGVLALTVRKLLGVQKETGKRGRKPNVLLNWEEFVEIKNLEENIGSVNAAINHLVAERGGENTKESVASAIQRRFTKSNKKWRNEKVPKGLAVLFSTPPIDDLDEIK